MNAPKVTIGEGALLYGDLPNISLVVGITLEFPALEQSPDDVKNEFFQRWETWLGNIPEKYALQVARRIDADFEAQLSHYSETTGVGEFDRHVRGINQARYDRAQEEGVLWNRKLDVFLSSFLTLRGSEGNITKRLQASAEGMRQFLEQLSPIVKAFGGAMTAHTSVTLARRIRETLGGVKKLSLLNETVEDVEQVEDFLDYVYPSGTIDGGEGVLFHDGQYHRFLVLDAHPQESVPFMASEMMRTSHHDVTFVTSLTVQAKAPMLNQLQTRYNRLNNDLNALRKKNKDDLRMADDLEELGQALVHLKKGSGGICKAILIAHIWATDRDTLANRVDEVRTNFALARGATLYESGLPTESRKLFYSTLPGYHGDWLKPFVREFDAALGARMLPLSAVFQGERKEPMALYQGHGHTLVGFSLFRGGRPLHTSIWGATGCGKSAFCNDFLTQMNAHLDQILIVESGNSYGVTVQLLGGRSLDLKVNSNQHINLFDTNGLPFLSEQKDTMARILSAMVGEVEGFSRDHVGAVLESTASDFMNSVRKEWEEHHEARVEELEKEYVLFLQHLEEVREYDFIAEFLKFRTALTHAEVEAVTEEDVLAVIQNPDLVGGAEAYRFSAMSPDDFQILERYRDYLEFFDTSEEDRDLRKRLATLLAPWCGGQYGNLLNGYTNIELTGRLVKVELSGLKSDLMKSVVLSLLNVIAYNEVLAAPRSQKKVWVFEELSVLGKEMPQLADIVEEIAQTGRKYNLCLVTIAQTFTAFESAPTMKRVVAGNMQQYVIFRSKSKSDLAELLEETKLPTSLTSLIMEYPSPSDTPEPHYSSALLAIETRSGWNMGTMLIHCPPAMLWASDSQGESYDEKMAVLQSDGAEEFISKLLNNDQAA